MHILTQLITAAAVVVSTEPVPAMIPGIQTQDI